MPKTVKKVWDKVRVQEVINADEETLRADAIWAGYSQSAIKGKNTQEEQICQSISTFIGNYV